jgi:hypothetical protein
MSTALLKLLVLLSLILQISGSKVLQLIQLLQWLFVVGGQGENFRWATKSSWTTTSSQERWDTTPMMFSEGFLITSHGRQPMRRAAAVALSVAKVLAMALDANEDECSSGVRHSSNSTMSIGIVDDNDIYADQKRPWRRLAHHMTM